MLVPNSEALPRGDACRTSAGSSHTATIKKFLQVGSFYSLEEYYKWKTRDDCASYR
jgi:hypothetical protein